MKGLRRDKGVDKPAVDPQPAVDPAQAPDKVVRNRVTFVRAHQHNGHNYAAGDSEMFDPDTVEQLRKLSVITVP